MACIDRTGLQQRYLRGTALLAVVFSLLTAGGAAGTAGLRGLEAGLLWAAKTGAVMAYILAFLGRSRRRALTGGNLEHLWGTANRLTLLRGALLAILAGFLFAPRPERWVGPPWSQWAAWLPALIYAIAAAADYADGWWAKRTHTQTRLGELLDGELDGVGILLASALAVQYRALPPVFLAVGLAKPLYALALLVRRLRGLPTFELPASRLRRRLAGVQMGLLAVVLWPIARAPATVLAACLVGIPFLLGFLRDGLVASGRLDPFDPRYLHLKAIAFRLAGSWLPLLSRGVLLVACGLRIASTAAAASEAARMGGRMFQPVQLLRAGPLPPDLLEAALGGSGRFSLPLSISAALVQTLAWLALIAGWAVPPAALLFLLPAGLRAFLGGLDPATGLAIGAALLLSLFGPGPRPLTVSGLSLHRLAKLPPRS